MISEGYDMQNITGHSFIKQENLRQKEENKYILNMSKQRGFNRVCCICSTFQYHW